MQTIGSKSFLAVSNLAHILDRLSWTYSLLLQQLQEEYSPRNGQYPSENSRFKNRSNVAEGPYESIGQFRTQANYSPADLKRSAVGFSLDPPQEVEDCEACLSGLLGINMLECPECGGSNKRNTLASKLKQILPFDSSRTDLLAIHLFATENPPFLEFLQGILVDESRELFRNIEATLMNFSKNVQPSSSIQEDVLFDCLQFFGLVEDNFKDRLQNQDMDPEFEEEIRRKIAEYRTPQQLFELVCWINANHVQMFGDPEINSAVNCFIIPGTCIETYKSD